MITCGRCGRVFGMSTREYCGNTCDGCFYEAQSGKMPPRKLSVLTDEDIRQIIREEIRSAMDRLQMQGIASQIDHEGAD